MKQNSTFSHAKRNNNNGKGMDSNEQYSSNVKETLNPKETKCSSIAKITK